jgi:hypothetical protein
MVARGWTTLQARPRELGQLGQLASLQAERASSQPHSPFSPRLVPCGVLATQCAANRSPHGVTFTTPHDAQARCRVPVFLAPWLSGPSRSTQPHTAQTAPTAANSPGADAYIL